MNINISFNTYLELEKIAENAFFPLKGFMTEKDFISVVNKMRLNNGKLFPLPVLLPIKFKEKEKLKINQKIFLRYRAIIVGTITVKSIFTIDFKKFINQLFGTEDLEHPGYKNLVKGGKYYIGGPINLIQKINYKHSDYSLSPYKVKQIFKKQKLKTVAGFQTRNVPHKAHEYILTSALKEVDGLLIHPLIGKKKKGDFLPKVILKSYDFLLRKFFPKGKVLLAALTTSMRYAGPREAIFHAIIRKNYGCTHFLVGRDHAGVGSYYSEYEAQDLCIKFEKEIGIKIIKVRGPFYCKYCKKITTDNICKRIENKVEVSGTKIRHALANNKKISSRFMRSEIVRIIKQHKIFI